MNAKPEWASASTAEELADLLEGVGKRTTSPRELAVVIASAQMLRKQAKDISDVSYQREEAIKRWLECTEQWKATYDEQGKYAESLRSALLSLEQAYSNPHSPPHRAACLNEARAALAKNPNPSGQPTTEASCHFIPEASGPVGLGPGKPNEDRGAKMTMRKQAALLAALALAQGGGKAMHYEEPPTPAQRKRWRAQRDYPTSGTGLRQGARLERQKAAGMLDFSASERCIERIAERNVTVLEP